MQFGRVILSCYQCVLKTFGFFALPFCEEFKGSHNENDQPFQHFFDHLVLLFALNIFHEWILLYRTNVF